MLHSPHSYYELEELEGWTDYGEIFSTRNQSLNLLKEPSAKQHDKPKPARPIVELPSLKRNDDLKYNCKRNYDMAKRNEKNSKLQIGESKSKPQMNESNYMTLNSLEPTKTPENSIALWREQRLVAATQLRELCKLMPMRLENNMKFSQIPHLPKLKSATKDVFMLPEIQIPPNKSKTVTLRNDFKCARYRNSVRNIEAITKSLPSLRY